jgi:hypothetical protein
VANGFVAFRVVFGHGNSQRIRVTYFDAALS